MRVGLIRHAKVLHHDPFFATGKIFEQGRIDYDMSAIMETRLKVSKDEFQVCRVSSKKRAIETAKLIYGDGFQITDELREVPTKALFLIRMHLPSGLRSVIGRIAWYINYHKMPETRKQSNERARKFLYQLLSEVHKDVLLITHGFFMQSLKHELKKVGFKGHCPLLPKNATLYVFERKVPALLSS